MLNNLYFWLDCLVVEVEIKTKDTITKKNYYYTNYILNMKDIKKF